jgi:hypothetical protein
MTSDYEGLSFINDDTFESVAPKITPPVMPFVVVPGKADFYFTDKIGKIKRVGKGIYVGA